MTGVLGDSLSDKDPPERDENYVLKRRAYLVERSVRVARYYTEGFAQASPKTLKTPSISYTVGVRKKSENVDLILANYFTEIDCFKIRHEMPTTELANECKRAAAWIIVGKKKDLWRGIFKHNFSEGFNQNLANDLPDMVFSDLIISLCYNELNIDEIKVDEDTQKLLRHNILKRAEQADFDWLVATMHLLAKAYGRKKKAKNDPRGC